MVLIIPASFSISAQLQHFVLFFKDARQNFWCISLWKVTELGRQMHRNMNSPMRFLSFGKMYKIGQRWERCWGFALENSYR